MTLKKVGSLGLLLSTFYLSNAYSTAYASSTPGSSPSEAKATSEASSADLEKNILDQPKFGVSLGLGSLSALGNRGMLLQGGFPMYELKVHFWLTSHFAFDLGASLANNYYNTSVMGLGHVDVSMAHVGMNMKYYANLGSISSILGFVSPYASAGVGVYTKTENSNAQQTTDFDSNWGVSAGGGLRFNLVPERAAFEAEGKIHRVSFLDSNSSAFQSSGISDLSGGYLTITGSMLIYL